MEDLGQAEQKIEDTQEESAEILTKKIRLLIPLLHLKKVKMASLYLEQRSGWLYVENKLGLSCATAQPQAVLTG